MNDRIYMDNAATTKIAPEVLDAMLPYLKEEYGNPSSAYSFSGKIAGKVAEARRKIGEVIGAKERELFFTSGGSESDNWAIKGVADALRDKGNHIIEAHALSLRFIASRIIGIRILVGLRVVCR